MKVYPAFPPPQIHHTNPELSPTRRPPIPLPAMKACQTYPRPTRPRRRRPAASTSGWTGAQRRRCLRRNPPPLGKWGTTRRSLSHSGNLGKISDFNQKIKNYLGLDLRCPRPWQFLPCGNPGGHREPCRFMFTYFKCIYICTRDCKLKVPRKLKQSRLWIA